MKNMRVALLFCCAILMLCSCGETPKPEELVVEEPKVEEPSTPEEAIAQMKKEEASTTGNAEFKDNKKKIEKVYGEQWDFCKCVVANDSLDKAVKSGNMSDKLIDRFDEVDNKCKAFLVMDANRTPDERTRHEKKIAKCLREAGIK